MKKTYITIIVIALVVLAGAGVYAYMTKQKAMLPANSRVGNVDNGSGTTDGKLKAANFSGKLEEVNAGCFADGECYVVVDGKHVTTTIGWSQDTVGSVQGVASFGDLESHIGKQVEVYAKDKGDGTYTLYGSEGFYVKLQ